MASAAAALPHRGAAHKSSAPAPNQPPGTFTSGTKVQVGNHRVTIERYLSEGGFAHVYVVRVPRDNNKYELAVLKRVAVPDKSHLANMRTEVETMKKLKGHRHVVTYMDSHASQLKGGGYEVFLLMEFCGGGGLIDFMNTRLQHRLTEPEILKIFADVAEGLAAMHYLKPPLLHRDLKVENVLISKTNSGAPLYKLCDFGSAAVPRPAATTPEEGRLIEEDVQQHTTMQYRSPEMIDVWRKQPINEKADIWALGVFLYKLCYYTTPFEDVGQMAILNATYKYPPYPSFSDRLKKFIAWMLKEDPRQRPNIYQVIKETCSMRGTDIPIKDIYADRTLSEARRNEALPSTDPVASPPPVGLQKVSPQVQAQALPDIAPMRRGRPTVPAQQAATAAQSKPAPSSAKGDPFAALDSKNFKVRSEAVDELSKRFPSLDEFSIAQDPPGEFPFSKPSFLPKESGPTGKANLGDRVTQALADEAFARSKPLPTTPKATPDVPRGSSKASPHKSIPPFKPREKLDHTPLVHQPTPVRPGTTYTTRGVGSSPPPVKPKLPAISSRPIWRVPDSSARSSSQPRASSDAEKAASLLKPSLPPSTRPALLDIHRSKSQTAPQIAPNMTNSSRPSLETRRSMNVDPDEPELTRARSAQNRSRPSSMYVDSNIDFLRDQEASRRQSIDGKRDSRNVPMGDSITSTDEQNIDDDLNFLRNSEDGERPRRKLFSHKKRTSLGNALGRFGDAFKRFEKDPSSGNDANELALVTSELEFQDSRMRELSPIEGSEAALSKHSDELDLETEDLPPDVKRELERRRLSDEERRVTQAAAQYRARVAEQGTGGPVPTRASTIQQRVQSLLDEGRQSSVKRTAEGYGRYTGADDPPQPSQPGAPTDRLTSNAPPIARKPATMEGSNNPYPRIQTAAPQASTPPTASSAPAFAGPPTQARVVTRPSVPPKSAGLRTGGSTRPPPQSDEEAPAQPPRPKGGLAALLAKDLEGVPDYAPRGSSQVEYKSAPLPASHDVDPELDFEKRYPSLSGIELVETEIGGQNRTRTRDV